MKLLRLFAFSLMAASLFACGDAQETAQSSSAESEAPMQTNHEAMNSGNHDMGSMSEGIGHGNGVIQAIGSQEGSLIIQHGPIEGIGMGAMTMGFDIMGDVDLSGLSEGDNVAFMVKQGRDGSYRVMTICDTDKSGADCLD
jgi:Cu/Ag efflux protein CusF